MVSIDKSKIYVFDDIIPSSTQDVLEDKIGRLHFRYAINHHQKPFTIKVKNDPKIWNQNRHGLLQSYQFDEKEWTDASDPTYCTAVLNSLSQKLGHVLEIQRIKINLNLKEHPENAGSCFHPHCDLNTDEWTAVYYVNQSDGDTLIFKERGMECLYEGKPISIKKRIKNKKGRIVMFNQSLLHCGIPPFESDYRVVINYNFRIT